MTDVAYPAGRSGFVLSRSNHRTAAVRRLKTVVASMTLAVAAAYAAPVDAAVTEFVVPDGPSITLQDGRVIDGHIVRIDQTDMVVQTDDGSTETLPRSTVANLVFETVTGRELVGELVGWTPGVYQLATAEAAIKVYSTAPAAAPPAEAAPVAAAPANTGPANTGNAVETAPGGAGQGASASIAAVTVDETVEGTETGLAGTQDAAVTPTADLSIQVSVENSKENGPPVAFNIELSEPSTSSVVLIYATIDGTAVNGEDYEANRGVVVMKPGEQVARIEAPVVDDDEQEEQEHLQLFLTVDPTVAVVENRQIVATIDDDD